MGRREAWRIDFPGLSSKTACPVGRDSCMQGLAVYSVRSSADEILRPVVGAPRAMRKTSALYAMAFAATFVVGAALGGAAVSFRTIPPMALLVARTNLAMVGKDAYVMYRYAAYPVARTALVKYADESKGSSLSTDPAESEGMSFDVGLTYARLVVAAERAGNRADADTFMNLAKDAFGRTRHSYDEAQIRAAVERLDKAWDEGLAGRPRQGQ